MTPDRAASPPPIPDDPVPPGPDRGGTPRNRRHHLVWLTIFLGVVVVGLLVEVSAERAHFHGVEGSQCLIRGVLGDEACPGCGLTRGTAFVLQGAWGSAWRIHPGGFVIALLCVGGVLWHGAALARRVPDSSRGIHWSPWVRGAILLGVILPWLWRLVG